MIPIMRNVPTFAEAPTHRHPGTMKARERQASSLDRLRRSLQKALRVLTGGDACRSFVFAGSESRATCVAPSGLFWIPACA